MLPAHRTYTQITNVVDKCTFCFHRVTQGLAPACVQTCIGRSRVFGDLNDPTSEVSYLVAKNATQVLRPEEGTKPHIFYIGADRNVTEHGRDLYHKPDVLDEDHQAFQKHFRT
jgi:Fe-S-cluster-containing dehydrogenase component